MKLPAFSEFQLREFSKYWFDLSKVIFASWVLKFFEPETLRWGGQSHVVLILGLTAAIAFVIVGLLFAKGVDKE